MPSKLSYLPLKGCSSLSTGALWEFWQHPRGGTQDRCVVKATKAIVLRPELLQTERREEMREQGFSLHENKCMRQFKKLKIK